MCMSENHRVYNFFTALFKFSSRQSLLSIVSVASSSFLWQISSVHAFSSLRKYNDNALFLGFGTRITSVL